MYKEKKNAAKLAVFLLFYATYFEKKKFKKLSIRLEISTKNNNSRYQYFNIEKNQVLGPKRKKNPYRKILCKRCAQEYTQVCAQNREILCTKQKKT